MQNNKKHGPDTRKCPEARPFFSAFSHVDFYQRPPFLLPLATSNRQKKNDEKNERKEKEIKENRKKNNVMKTNTTSNYFNFVFLGQKKPPKQFFKNNKNNPYGFFP